MARLVAPALFAIVMLVGFASVPAPSRAYRAQEEATPAASPTADGLCAAGMPADWFSADVRPEGVTDAVVIPAAEQAMDEPAPVRQLSLIVITLPPGHCMPYSALGNQKDGAVILLVQQGHLEFRWQPDPAAGGMPTVMRGNSGGTLGAVPVDDTQDYYPGDWITLDQQVRFSYRNVGGDSAIVLKAVWAPPIMGGCGGGCK
jgi:hypothetical protein